MSGAKPSFRVFAQRNQGSLPIDELARAAERFRLGSLRPATAGTGENPGIEIRHATMGSTLERTYRVGVRRAEPDDWAAARDAEARGKVGGLAELAARCSEVWDVTTLEPVDESEALEFCAVLAAVGLGPILPASLSALWGVKSARERAARLREVPR